MRLIIIYNDIHLISEATIMTLTRSLALLGAALLASSTPTLAADDGFQLQHSTDTLTLAVKPQRIVSFDLGVLDTLAALDVPVVGVAKSVYEGPMARYKDTQVVGTLFEPDYAVLKEIKPDLIVAGSRAAKAVPELEKVAPTVSFTSDPTAFMTTFRESSLALGKAFGKEEQAAAALNKIEKNVEELKKINAGKKAVVLFTINGNVIAHAPGDRFGYAYELTGTESVLPAKDPNAPVPPRPEPNSPEAKAAAEARAKVIADVAAAEPDWLLVLDRGAINNGERTAEATLAKHPKLSQTRAFKEGRVHYMNPNGWYVIGTGLNNVQAITDSLLADMRK